MPIQRALKTNGVKAAHIAANAVGSSELDLTANYDFTGTVTGAGNFQKVSSVTSDATGIGMIEIDLPTTTDFAALHLHLLGLRCESGVDQYWALQLRQDSNDTYLTGSNEYTNLHNLTYNNNSSQGTASSGTVVGNNYVLLKGGFAGDGSDETEMSNAIIEIYKNADSTRATRGFFRFGIEKRHTDEWHYISTGSFVTDSTVVVDRVKIFLHGGANFTHRGYALYKLTV